MNIESKQQLFAIVRSALATHDAHHVARVILAAHNGRPDGDIVVPNVNLHLFRQYRNAVSANPVQLIDEARAADVAVPLTIRVRKNSYGEFEVPCRGRSLYFTGDRQDAIDTAIVANAVSGQPDPIVVIRSGTYQKA